MKTVLNKRIYFLNIGMMLLLIGLFYYDLSLGSFKIPLSNIFKFWDQDALTNAEYSALKVFRYPRVITAVCAGAALSLSGLLMQTLFQNPLAGPYVLGINAGASLMVALATMTGFSFFSQGFGLIGAALIGALMAGLVILGSAVYVRSKIALLLVGIMLGAFVGALVNVIQAYSSPDDLKTFMLWSFGSLQHVDQSQIPILVVVTILGILFALLLVKPLNLLVLGDVQSKYMGVNVKFIRFLLILITALLTGTITAFCGPIAFVGLITPNIVKFLYKTQDHLYLMFGTVVLGALLILVCDILMQLFAPYFQLPLNAVTAMMGAPIVVWIIFKRF